MNSTDNSFALMKHILICFLEWSVQLKQKPDWCIYSCHNVSDTFISSLFKVSVGNTGLVYLESYQWLSEFLSSTKITW